MDTIETLAFTAGWEAITDTSGIRDLAQSYHVTGEYTADTATTDIIANCDLMELYGTEWREFCEEQEFDKEQAEQYFLEGIIKRTGSIVSEYFNEA